MNYNYTGKKKLSLLLLIWEFWDFSPILKLNELFNSLYISFYKPWLKWNINRNKIIEFNEFNKSFFLWPFKMVARTLKILKEIRKFKPNIVVTHHDDANVSVLLPLFITKYIHKKKIKFVAYIHNWNFNEKSLLNTIIRFCIKRFYKYFDTIITVSYDNKNMLEQQFWLKNIEVIYNPVDIKNAICMAENEDKNNKQLDFIKRLKRNNFIIWHIWRLTKQKWQDCLIKAFKKLNKIYPNTKLIIIWKWELEDSLIWLVKDLSLEHDVIFLWIQTNVFQFIKYFDCFILTSLWESFGQVLVEALALNKLVISTDCKSWPREILAPEIKLQDNITYPYYGKYWILIEPFISEDKFIKNINQILIDILEKNLKKHYLDWSKRAKEFDLQNIEKHYKKLFLN